MRSETVLSVFAAMPHFSHHSDMLFKLKSSSLWSSTELIARNTTQSSANSLIWVPGVTMVTMSFIYKRKSKGPKTLPWGTPEVTGRWPELWPSTDGHSSGYTNYAFQSYSWWHNVSFLCALLVVFLQNISCLLPQKCMYIWTYSHVCTFCTVYVFTFVSATSLYLWFTAILAVYVSALIIPCSPLSSCITLTTTNIGEYGLLLQFTSVKSCNHCLEKQFLIKPCLQISLRTQ